MTIVLGFTAAAWKDNCLNFDMKSGSKFLILIVLGWRLAAQVVGAAAFSTFDLEIKQRVGYDASVKSVVVRGSHLYFLCSDSHESTVIETDLEGTFQNLIQTGIQNVATFDVDEEGNLYALSEDSWFTVFYPNGGIRRTAHLEPNVLAFALVDGKPMIADENDRLSFLEREGERFTLSAWPHPWRLFGIGSGQLAVWRPQGMTISVLQMEDGLSTRRLSQTDKYVAAAGDLDGRVFLLNAGVQVGIAELHEFDNHLRPGWIRRFALPDDFHPQMIGASREHFYLADGAGKAVVYPLSSSPETRFLADVDPVLLSDLTRLRDAIKQSGYKSFVTIQLVIETDGTPRLVQIHGPAVLSNQPEVIAAIQALHFRPKIQLGSPTASSMTLEIGRNQLP